MLLPVYGQINRYDIGLFKNSEYVVCKIKATVGVANDTCEHSGKVKNI